MTSRSRVVHHRAASLIQAWKHFCACAEKEGLASPEATEATEAAILRASRRFDGLVTHAATAPCFDEVVQAIQKMAANPGHLALDAHGMGNLLGAASNAHADVVYTGTATGQSLRSVLVAVPVWGEAAAHHVAARAADALRTSGWVPQASRVRCLAILTPRRTLELAQDPARAWALSRAAALHDEPTWKALLSPASPAAAGACVRVLLLSAVTADQAAFPVVDAVTDEEEQEAASRWAVALQGCMEDAGVEDVVVCQPASLDEAAMVALAIEAVSALATAASKHAPQESGPSADPTRTLQEVALLPASDNSGVTLAARLDDGTELVLHAALPPEAVVWMHEIAACMDLDTTPAIAGSLAGLPWRTAPHRSHRLH